ncbi:MAG: hypothetical protein AAF688_14320 [Bacteroidota bacterium]
MASGALGILLFLFLNIYDMRYLSCLFFFFILVTSCDEGDIIEVNLDFDEELELCTLTNNSNEEFFLIYNINESTNEVLAIQFPVSGNSVIFNPEFTGDIETLMTNGNTIRFNYRTYDGDPTSVICSVIPGDVNLVSNFEADNGANIVFTSLFTDDDNDEIDTEDEFPMAPNDNGEFPNAQDTDEDGLFDYLDADDDGDNLLTSFEAFVQNEDGEMVLRDTDSDGIPDYLDPDDDNDGILTINEDADGNEENGILGPSNDLSPDSTVLRCRDASVSDFFEQDSLIVSEFTRTITVDIEIDGVALDILQTDLIEMGRYDAPQLTFRYNHETNVAELQDDN